MISVSTNSEFVQIKIGVQTLQLETELADEARPLQQLEQLRRNITISGHISTGGPQCRIHADTKTRYTANYWKASIQDNRCSRHPIEEALQAKASKCALHQSRC